jgi:hypothetical protein
LAEWLYFTKPLIDGYAGGTAVTDGFFSFTTPYYPGLALVATGWPPWAISSPGAETIKRASLQNSMTNQTRNLFVENKNIFDCAPRSVEPFRLSLHAFFAIHFKALRLEPPYALIHCDY